MAPQPTKQVIDWNVTTKKRTKEWKATMGKQSRGQIPSLWKNKELTARLMSFLRCLSNSQRLYIYIIYITVAEGVVALNTKLGAEITSDQLLKAN